jgi:squalene-hopene/tetraprenyl-beta-curcumene cyclase
MTTTRYDPAGPTSVSAAISSGAEALFAAQRPDGVFDYGGSTLTSTLATVGAVGALHFADPGGSADLIAAGTGWLRSTQNADGGWAMVPGDASESGPTAVAAAVLHLANPDANHEAIAAGLEWLRGYGGLEAIPQAEIMAWCRQFYGFAGWLDPTEMRRFPLELALLPGLYRRRFDLRLPMVSALGLAQTRHKSLTRLQKRLSAWAESKALAVIRQVYEHEGSTGAWCEDAWVTGLVCIGLARAGLGQDMVNGAVAWFRRMMAPDGSWSKGPLDLTWSMYATAGLVEAGYADDNRLVPTKALFLRLQQDRPFLAFGCPPGFWGWSAHGWPATLEHAEILSALCHLPGTEQAEAVRRGVTWLTLQQDTRGSWGLCVRNTKVANSGPCPHMTAQAVDGLLDSGVPADDRRVRRALRWLAKAQRPDGSFESLWYRMHTAGTSAVLQTFIKAGQGGAEPAQRAVRWLERTRLPDGSWGDGSGASGTIEETGWAVSALLAAGMPSELMRTGVEWLLSHRLPDGGWPAARINEYVRYVCRYPNPALAHGLALKALARYRKAVA